MPILTTKALSSFTTPWYGHEGTKSTVLSVQQTPTVINRQSKLSANTSWMKHRIKYTQFLISVNFSA